MKVSGFFHRFICLVMVAMLLVLPAKADTFDLSKMTDDEIVSRGINKTASLPQGSYIAGKDLPVGRYIFTCKAMGDDWGNVTVKSDGGSGKLIIWEVVSAPGEGEEPQTIFIALSKGDDLD